MSKFNYIYADPVISGAAHGDQWACATASDGAYDKVPYGTYNNDNIFCSESVDICKWTARRLGHPVMQLEFNSSSIFSMFEEAVSEYSQFISSYNMKNWFWDSYGSDTKLSGSQFQQSSSDGTNMSQMGTGSFQTVHPHMGITTVLSDQYGQSAGVGGDVKLYSGSITLTGSQQQYDLQTAFSASFANDASFSTYFDAGASGSNDVAKRIEIQRVFNYAPSAITRFWDPFVGTFDQRMMLDQFGFASYSPATTFTLRPMYSDILRAQAIETSDYIRKSNYSFEIVNNIVKIFPEPGTSDAGKNIWFEYFIRDDIHDTSRSYTSSKVSDPSNIPYKFITYSEINAHGRQWIRKYTLSLSKELLGIIRSKYASMPLPNGEVTMDGEALKAEGREEKLALIDELKEFLDALSLSEKSRMEAESADATQQVLNKSPMSIYVG